MDERLTNCECQEAGFCSRHQCDKTAFRFEMCRRSKGWFDLYEVGRGPGQRDSAVGTSTLLEACRHRGETIRSETCPTCSGTVQLKVFSCALHQECTLPMKLDTVKSCATCEDYEVI
jgi:hypothetical protein